jgi:hypothetical protein
MSEADTIKIVDVFRTIDALDLRVDANATAIDAVDLRVSDLEIETPCLTIYRDGADTYTSDKSLCPF